MMKAKIVAGVAWGALALAAIQLVAGIATQNLQQAIAAATAIVSAILPAVIDWLNPTPAPPTPHA